MDLNEIDEIIDLQELNLIRERRPYQIKERQENFNRWDNEQFFQRFRFSKETVIYILRLIEDNIRYDTEKNQAVSPLDQLLITLRFYSCGSHQIVLGDFGGIHRTTMGKILRRVTAAIVHLRAQFIFMPSTFQEKTAIKTKFFRIAQFPRVIGAIDCTHIRIQSPGGEDAEHFRNRKGYFSLNVQVICDADYKIRDIVCRWPGATHDSTIFQNSRIRMKFERGDFNQDVLLGDSAYPLKSFLITPIPNPVNRLQIFFNSSQIKTRTIIERTFGIWKRRFPILTIGMKNKIVTIQNIIMATAILHNIARETNQEDLEIEINNDHNEQEAHDNHHNDFDNNARQPFIDFFGTIL